MKTTAILSTIRESSDDELVARARRLEDELFQHRLKRYTNQLENTNLIRSTRREIARVNTILAARKQGVETRGEAKAASAAEAAPEKKAAKAAKKAPAKKASKKADKE